MAGIAHPVELTAEERSRLEGVAQSGVVAHRAAQRARLVLLAAEGRSDSPPNPAILPPFHNHILPPLTVDGAIRPAAPCQPTAWG